MAGFKRLAFNPMRINLSQAILGVAIVLLSACSSIPIDSNRNGDVPLQESHSILNLPYFPQEDDQCGPASLATMLAARDINVSPEALRAQVYIPSKQGSLTTEMVARARRQGLLVYPLKPQLFDIVAEVSADNPVLVLQNLGFNWLPRWHFTVVIGYDLAQQSLTLRSGQHRNYQVPIALFLKTWQRADHWAVIINKPQQLPQTAEQAVFLKAANELELVGETEAALAAYKTALKHWPDNTLAFFGAANSAYALGNYAQASDFFKGYLKQAPNSAAGWNNFAYSLLENNCLDEATNAIDCALKLAPTNAEYLDSYSEITEQVKHPKQSQNMANINCELPRCPL